MWNCTNSNQWNKKKVRWKNVENALRNKKSSKQAQYISHIDKQCLYEMQKTGY